MRVIVSTKLTDNYQNFVVVDSLRKAKNIDGISTVIIHTFSEDNFSVGVYIAELYKSGVKNFIYISASPDIAIKNSIIGIKGVCIDDEFYFDDEEELLALAEEVESDGGNMNTSLVATSTDIVRDFIARYARGDETIQAPLYLEQVSNALDELSTITQQQQTQLIDMGNTAMDTFNRASSIISNMSKQKKLIEEKLKQLEDSKQQIAVKSTFGSNVLFFPTYKYTGTPKLLLIREYSPCRYLTSFMLAYEHYLHYSRNKRVKLIFIGQKGQGVMKKYSNYTSITAESMNMKTLYDADILFTNNPKQEVMREILTRPTDIYIVVDRLYSNQDIVSGRVNKLSAVSGSSDLKRFNIKPENCIFSVTQGQNAFLTIPTIKGYPGTQDMRYVAYMQICKDSLFKKLDSFLQLAEDGR